jgi:hypothetical protein
MSGYGLGSFGTLSSVNNEFDEWIASLHLNEPDQGGNVGTEPAGRMDFLREVFDAHGGPVQPVALDVAWRERELQLIAHAVDLVESDLRRTTTLSPSIEIRTLDDNVVAVTYDGSYQTPVLFSIRAPEAVCEVAGNIRDQVVDDLWTVWPTCPTDGLGLDPVPISGQAVWRCRVGKHTVSKIGQLPSSG